MQATAEERRACGKSARNRAPRGTLGHWAEEDRGHEDRRTLFDRFTEVDVVRQFARLYAEQNERDHAQLVNAIAAGAVQSLPG
jgi:hypothetical protein